MKFVEHLVKLVVENPKQWKFRKIESCSTNRILISCQNFLEIFLKILLKNFADQNLEFWPNCRFLTKISIFDQYLDFWPISRLLTKISSLNQNLDFWPKFWFFIKISIFHQNLDLWPKSRNPGLREMQLSLENVRPE